AEIRFTAVRCFWTAWRRAARRSEALPFDAELVTTWALSALEAGVSFEAEVPLAFGVSTVDTGDVEADADTFTADRSALLSAGVAFGWRTSSMLFCTLGLLRCAALRAGAVFLGIFHCSLPDGPPGIIRGFRAFLFDNGYGCTVFSSFSKPDD